MTVLIPEKIHEAGISYLRERGYRVMVDTGADHASLLARIQEADAAIIRGAVIDREILQAGAPRLKVVARHGIGWDNVDVQTADRLGIYVTFTPQASIHAVAEHAVALLLAMAKHLKSADQSVREGRWLEFKQHCIGKELRDCVLGLIGVGRIGREVADIAAGGFGMKVLAFDPFANLSQLPSHITLLPSREAVLQQSDFVSLHLPLTEDTRRTVDSTFFLQMKEGAILINTSRGEIVDQDALLSAVRSGQVGGAALDVMDPEPLPKDHPLGKEPRLLLTPHYATLTETTQIRLAVDAARCVHAVLSGEVPPWSVNHPEVR